MNILSGSSKARLFGGEQLCLILPFDWESEQATTLGSTTSMLILHFAASMLIFKTPVVAAKGSKCKASKKGGKTTCSSSFHMA